MRITNELLLKIAKQIAAQLVRKHKQLVCVYLTGSLLTDEPLLGQTTDVDLFVIHSGEPPQPREVFPFTDEVHIDIAHLSQSIFHQPRNLRVHPWLTPFLCLNPICLYDIQHWFEFTQAGACAQSNLPDYVLQRARTLAEDARALWFDLKTSSYEKDSERLLVYLKSITQSANAIVTLTSAPLTERRFLVQYPQRAEALGRPGLASGLVDLIMSQPVSNETWDSWLTHWEDAMDALSNQENCPQRLNPCRKPYYLNAASVLRNDHPEAALWPILRSWTLAVSLLPEKSPFCENWREACNILELGDNNFSENLKSLDVYLDVVEETLDIWAEKNGL
nr:hypothetical protein [Anaerolineaceae bacterium]